MLVHPVSPLRVLRGSRQEFLGWTPVSVKLRVPPRQSRGNSHFISFDPDKYGWPWFPDTVSWVVPTAFAILALKQLACSCGGLEHVATRIDCGIQMLFDRACPGGGWNAGDRKSTRLNSSHVGSSYAAFCL